jgi:uncharacterized protein with HEPN domain
MRNDHLRLLDILEAIHRIETYSTQGKANFENQELVQVWIIHHLQIIGEAASKLSKEFCKQSSEISWPQIVAMRNILVHEYFGIDTDEVWQTVEVDIPILKTKISKYIKEFSND